MNIIDKFNEAKPSIKPGMLILFRGTSDISKAIQDITQSYWNHSGIVIDINGELGILDANADGVHSDLLSERISEYADAHTGSVFPDFCCIDLLQEPPLVAMALQKVIDTYDGEKYNFGRDLEIAIKDKLGIDLPFLDEKGRVICSQLAQCYTDIFPISCFSKETKMIPQDFIADANSSVSIIFSTPTTSL